MLLNSPIYHAKIKMNKKKWIKTAERLTIFRTAYNMSNKNSHTLSALFSSGRLRHFIPRWEDTVKLTAQVIERYYHMGSIYGKISTFHIHSNNEGVFSYWTLCSVRDREADASQNPYTSQSSYPSVDRTTARHLSCFFWNYHLEESSDWWKSVNELSQISYKFRAVKGIILFPGNYCLHHHLRSFHRLHEDS